MRIPFYFLPSTKYTHHGTRGNDDIYGTRFNDIYYGYDGNDTFYSSKGADIFDGSWGLDTVDYSASESAVIVRLDMGKGTGGHAQGDSYIDVENVTGSDFDDEIHGNSANNVISGGEGDDTLYGYAGDDTFTNILGSDRISGGNGFDTLDYSDSTGRILVNLEQDFVYRYNPGQDSTTSTVLGIDKVIGGSGSDEFRGTVGSDHFVGGGSTDQFYLDEGADTYEGGSGNDWLYAKGDDMLIDLEAGTGSGGVAEGDSYSSIESIFVYQSQNVDLTGSGADNLFSIQGSTTGDIDIDAGEGDDTVYLGFSQNHPTKFETHDSSVFDGGLGSDTIDTGGTASADVVIDLEGGRYYEVGNSGDDITLISFENATGGAGDDILIDAAETDSVLEGRSGADIFRFDHDGDANTEADTINDFKAGIDRIDLDDTEISDWNDLNESDDGDYMYQVDNGVMIVTADASDETLVDTIFLKNVELDELDADDFIF